MKKSVTSYGKNIKVYKDRSGEWRWRIKADNGNIISASTESYKQKKDCTHNLIQTGVSIVNSSLFAQWKDFADEI